jgi:glutathione S-transferase
MELFFAPLACSMASRIAFAEANGDVTLTEVDPKPKRLLVSGDDYRALNPLGYVPALRLNDGSILTENVAILEYIADRYPEARLAPPVENLEARAKLRQWLAFISTELHKGLMMPLLSRDATAEVKAWAWEKYRPRLVYVDKALEGCEFLFDRFTVADAYLVTVLNWTQATPQIDMARFPNAKAYLERLRTRPSVAKALEVEIPAFRAEIARAKAA